MPGALGAVDDDGLAAPGRGARGMGSGVDRPRRWSWPAPGASPTVLTTLCLYSLLFQDTGNGDGMDINLVTAAEAARRAGISTRTISRWLQEGRLNRYWWGRRARRLGPRVAMTEVERLLGIVTSKGRDFLLNRPRRGFVEIRDHSTGEPVDTGAAVAHTDASIEAAVPTRTASWC